MIPANLGESIELPPGILRQPLSYFIINRLCNWVEARPLMIRGKLDTLIQSTREDGEFRGLAYWSRDRMAFWIRKTDFRKFVLWAIENGHSISQE